jgi:signal transduction histidine kinase/ActR/RegA family two-component response regulator
MSQVPAPGGSDLPRPDLRRALTEAPDGEPFERLTRCAAAALKAPAALLAVVAEGREVWKGAFGLAEPSAAGEAPPASPLLRQLAAGGDPLELPNAHEDPRFAHDPLVAGAGVTSFLGVPLGPLSACLAVMDFRPRGWAAEETQLLRDLARSAADELEVFRLREELRAGQGEVLRERREKAALLTGIPLGIILLDPEGHITLCNPEAARVLRLVSGRNPEQLLGKSIWQECPEIADSTFARALRQAEAEGRPCELETYLPRLRRWFAFRGTRSPEGLCLTFQDVTERTQLEKSLRARAEESAEAARGREEFLTVLAHELRDALAPIRNALHLWGTGGPAAAEGEESRALAEREVQRVTRFLEDLLEVSHLAPDSLRPNLERVDLGEVVAEAVRAVLAAPEGRGHRLIVDLPPEPLAVEGDRRMLEQVLGHLLSNAAKFTRPGGQIWVEARSEEDAAVLRVRDSGVGIAPEMLPRIFDLFLRAGRSEAHLQRGLGVGLTLVRRLVRLHGGRVEARSEGAGRGSEFIIRLPAAEAAPAPAAALNGSGRKPLRILIVDNSKEAAQSVAVLLRTWGYEVRVTYDPFAALEEARACRPQVILLDIGMPGMDGYEVAQRLRGQGELRGAVLVAVTGYGEEEDRRRAREAGFDYHMVKPVDPNDLRALLELAEGLAKPTS